MSQGYETYKGHSSLSLPGVVGFCFTMFKTQTDGSVEGNGMINARLSMGFSQQEYWSGLPCPLPGDLPYLGIKPASPVSHTIKLP